MPVSEKDRGILAGAGEKAATAEYNLQGEVSLLMNQVDERVGDIYAAVVEIHGLLAGPVDPPGEHAEKPPGKETPQGYFPNYITWMRDIKARLSQANEIAEGLLGKIRP